MGGERGEKGEARRKMIGKGKEREEMGEGVEVQGGNMIKGQQGKGSEMEGYDTERGWWYKDM